MKEAIIAPASPDHIDAIVSLLPRLADFTVPGHRDPADLWQGDAAMLRAWANGHRDDLTVVAASGSSGELLGVAAASEREELLTHAASAHLEVLAVASAAEGQGLGRQLLASIEQAMRDKGARGMSLHVFGNNTRARALYSQAGFDEEIIRCFKPFY